MTSSVITLPLLLTPALKNNIYPVCHHRTVGVCVCMRLPVSASAFNDDFHSPLSLRHLITAGMDTACLCETDLSQEKWEQGAEYHRRTETSLVTHNMSIRRYLNS